jgi:hypothetical protein
MQTEYPPKRRCTSVWLQAVTIQKTVVFISFGRQYFCTLLCNVYYNEAECLQKLMVNWSTNSAAFMELEASLPYWYEPSTVFHEWEESGLYLRAVFKSHFIIILHFTYRFASRLIPSSFLTKAWLIHFALHPLPFYYYTEYNNETTECYNSQFLHQMPHVSACHEYVWTCHFIPNLRMQENFQSWNITANEH